MSKGFYRSRDGVVFGVCKGIAESFDLSVGWLRLLLVAAFLLSGFFPAVALYLVLALVMKPKPVIEPSSEDEEEFYQSYASSRSLGLARLKAKFENIESRVRRMERHVTSRAYDWQSRLDAE